MDEAAYIRAIVADPDNDVPRLAYTDWLVSQGRSERAEFIRVQIALAWSPDHPNRTRLQDRESELLKAHEREWAPNNALALFFEWRRGFVAALHPAARGVFGGEDSLKILAEFPLAEKLVIGFCMTDAEFRHMPDLPNLKSLDIGGNVRLTNDAIRRIGSWRTLRRLRLTGYTITDLALPHLAVLSDLRELDLSYSKITDAGLHHLVTLVGLESLDVSETKVTGRGLSALRGLPRMRRLNLVNTVYYDAGLGGLSDCRALEELLIGSMDLLHPATEADLSVLRELSALRVLDLGAWIEPADEFVGVVRQYLPSVELRFGGQSEAEPATASTCL